MVSRCGFQIGGGGGNSEFNLLLTENKALFDETTYKRAKHAVTEIKRTIEAAEALKSNDMVKLGKLMIESHNSLK